MLTISKGVSWTTGNFPRHPLQLVYFECVRCSWVVCECIMLLFFVSFYAKQCDHGYYFAGAGHSVALKQFSLSSCLQELTRKETHLLNKHMLCKTYLCSFNVVYKKKRYAKIWMVNFSMICLSTGCTVVLEHYCSCDGLLQWNLSWREHVLKVYLSIKTT